jgi:type IV pilus biogenesis protein CpaD/CtpE
MSGTRRRNNQFHRLAVQALLAMILAGCGAEKSTFDEKIVCNCPNDKRPSKTIARWKYDRVRTEILAVLPEGDAGMEYAKLREQVLAKFSKADTLQIGNLTWYVDTVMLHLETIGEVTRETDSKSPLPKHVKRK